MTPCTSPPKTNRPISVRFRSGTETLVYRPVSDWWWGKATEREFGAGWQSKLPLEIVAYEEHPE